MKKILFAIFLILTSCSIIRTVPAEEVKTVYVDSLIYHIDTVEVEIPREVYRDYTSLLDTLTLETSVAISKAYADTSTMTIKGELVNKQTSLRGETKYVERIIRTDSTVVKTVPVEVVKEVSKTPKWCVYSLLANLLLLVYVGVRIGRFVR